MSDRPVALVTGAAGGIGRATCLRFAQRGYDVALLSPPGDALDTVAQEVRGAGAKILALPVDLVELDRVEAAVGEIHSTWGRLDVLVNNAAWRELMTMRRLSVESWDKTLRVCLTAPAFLARWCAELMCARGHGVIVNVSSIRAQQADALGPAYVAAKGGLEALTYSLASLYGPSGIRVVAVAPGAVDTPLSADLADEAAGDEARQAANAQAADFVRHTPLGRWATAEEIARAIVMLAGEDASYITGTTIVVDGGRLRNATAIDVQRALRPGEIPS